MKELGGQLSDLVVETGQPTIPGDQYDRLIITTVHASRAEGADGDIAHAEEAVDVPLRLEQGRYGCPLVP